MSITFAFLTTNVLKREPFRLQ